MIDNAIKYSPKGGPVVVAVRRVGSEAVVSVRDEGIGIAGANQPRLFEAFYQEAPMMRPTVGMGLGLHLCREITRLHGGRSWFESELGVGSTFFFSLPLAAADGVSSTGDAEGR